MSGKGDEVIPNMKVDTVVKDCRIVRPTGLLEASIAINDGKIVAISKEPYLPEAHKVIDAEGNYVIPGVIDVHTHFGAHHSLEEDMKDTIGAVFGGVTTVGNYLGLGKESGKDSYQEKFEIWKGVWEKLSFCDVFFHSSIISEENLREINRNGRDFGIASSKFFMAYKGPEGEEIGAAAADDGLLWAGFKDIASLSYPARAMVHAENIDIIYRIKKKIEATGRQDLAAWDESRPGFCESLDIKRAISIAQQTGAPLYVVHVHYRESVDVIEQAQRQGIDVVGETCPQYLVLDRTLPVGPLGKINPPITAKDSCERLWQGIRDGVINCIGTDHSSTTTSMKKELWHDAAPGIPGVEHLLPLMLSEGVNKERITIQKLVEVLCANNAKVFGIWPQKGVIQVGSDADLVIIALTQKGKIALNKEHCISDYTLYDGWEITGWPILTILRGNIVVADNRLQVNPGLGKYLPRYC
ncbi:dihydroorotase family protein [Chloroflexota bacterium]